MQSVSFCKTCQHPCKLESFWRMMASRPLSLHSLTINSRVDNTYSKILSIIMGFKDLCKICCCCCSFQQRLDFVLSLTKNTKVGFMFYRYCFKHIVLPWIFKIIQLLFNFVLYIYVLEINYVDHSTWDSISGPVEYFSHMDA